MYKASSLVPVVGAVLVVGDVPRVEGQGLELRVEVADEPRRVGLDADAVLGEPELDQRRVVLRDVAERAAARTRRDRQLCRRGKEAGQGVGETKEEEEQRGDG